MRFCVMFRSLGSTAQGNKWPARTLISVGPSSQRLGFLGARVLT